MKHLLFWLYLWRAVAVLLYLMAPKTEFTFYVFAAVLGVTWLSTVPPTAGLVGKLFGGQYLSTLFGLTLLSHQLGGLSGARRAAPPARKLRGDGREWCARP